MDEFKELSNEVSETQKLNDQIETLQKQKKGALEELGNVVYTDFSQGTFDDEKIKKNCESIREIDSQIKESEEILQQIFEKVKESILRLKTIAFCDCGAELFEGVKFCYQCGKRVEKEEKGEKIEKRAKRKEEKAASNNTCSQCGAQLSSGAQFCSKCGVSTSPYL